MKRKIEAEIERDGITLQRTDDGVISIERDGFSLGFDENVARWLAITALPAILPAVPSPKAALDERLNRG